MARAFDPKAKAKRQKIIAAVGAVLLLAVLAIQVPRTMKMLNAEAPVPPPASATPTSGDPSVLPTPGSVGGSTPTPAVGESGGTLIDSDVAPTPEAGQLVSFGRFESKDPFAQQIDLDAAGASGGGGEKQPADPGSPPKPGGMTSGEPRAAPARPAAAAGTAVISVNGAEETVAVKSDFPKAEPVFTLVSLAGGEAKIAIAGGALASGAPTLTLKKGTPVTLVNTADGIRYELELVG
jgi:hypothetical protein